MKDQKYALAVQSVKPPACRLCTVALASLLMLTFAGPASLPGEHCIYVRRITTNLPIKQTRFTAAYRQPIQFGLACNRLSRLPLVFHQSDSRRCFNKPGLLV